MKEIIEIIKDLDHRWGFTELQIATDYARSETIISFYLDYIEERVSDPFLRKVFPMTKQLLFKGTSDDSGRVFVKLVFDGIADMLAN